MADNCNKTPKKLVKCSPNDACRICKCNLKIEYGAARVYYENLFKPSERKESKGLLLSRACEIVGLPVQKSPLLSERICRPCGRKIRNVYENFTFLKDNLSKLSFKKSEVFINVSYFSSTRSANSFGKKRRFLNWQADYFTWLQSFVT